MYRKVPSPFVVHGLTEAYWGRKSWPILMDLLEDLNNIFMIDGEKMGLESSRRRNNGRQWKPDTKAPRKLMGRRLDLIARDVQDQKDWMIVERMKNWDEVSNKFLKESNCDLFRETHTIMTSRVRDTVNKGFRDEARFFGVYTGGQYCLEVSCIRLLFPDPNQFDITALYHLHRSRISVLRVAACRRRFVHISLQTIPSL
jgi:hypothetical protein